MDHTVHCPDLMRFATAFDEHDFVRGVKEKLLLEVDEIFAEGPLLFGP